MGWHIRRLEQKDESSFIPFLGRRISDRSVQQHFDWLYRGSPHGDAVTWLAIRDEGEQIIGCTSVFTRILNFVGNELLAGHGGDAYVDPDFRRQGIAQSLHAHSVADMKKLGMACTYGVAPVPANFRAFIRAGALSPCKLRFYTLPLDATWITKRIQVDWIRSAAEKLLNPLARFYVEHRSVQHVTSRVKIQIVPAFDLRIDKLFDSVAHLFGICGKRDAAYLNWRFVNHPFKKYTLIECNSREKLVGYAVLDMQPERCIILDFLAHEDEAAPEYFLRSLVQFARDSGKSSMSLILNPSGPYATLFDRSGFFKTGENLPLMVLTTGSAEQDEKFNDPKNWFLTLADKDTS